MYSKAQKDVMDDLSLFFQLTRSLWKEKNVASILTFELKPGGYSHWALKLTFHIEEKAFKEPYVNIPLVTMR